MPHTRASGISAKDQWLTETVRRAEERWGPYEDSVIVRALAGAPSSMAGSPVIARNLAIAQREGLVSTARRWQSNAVLAMVVLALLAILVGWSAGRGALGDGSQPVNLFWALGALLGLNALTFIVWVLAMLFGHRSSGLIGRLVLAVAKRLTKLPHAAAVGEHWNAHSPPAAALLPGALMALLQRARLQRVLFGVLTHGWWLLTLLTTLGTLIVLLSTRRYEFLWETTLLSPDTFVGLTHALGYLPALFGFSIPDAELVRASDGLQPLTSADHALWSTFLLGCVVLYGVLPRAAALLVCGVLAWHRRHAFAVDFNAPSLVALQQRLQVRAATVGILDPDRSDPHASGPASAWAQGSGPEHLTGDLRVNTAQHADVIVGVELPADTPWPPGWLPTGVLDAGIIDERLQRNALLEHMARHQPRRLLIVCDAHQTPDRGSIALIAELLQHAGSGKVLILDSGRTPHREDQWRTHLMKTGIETVDLLNDSTQAAAWLHQSRTLQQENQRHD